MSNSWLFKDTIMQKQPSIQEWPVMLNYIVDAMSFGKNNYISVHQNASSFLNTSAVLQYDCIPFLLFNLCSFKPSYNSAYCSSSCFMNSLWGKQTLWFDIGATFLYILSIIFLSFTINKPSVVSEYYSIFCCPLCSIAHHVFWK